MLSLKRSGCGDGEQVPLRISMRWFLVICFVLLSALRPATAETAKGCNPRCAERTPREYLVCSELLQSNPSCQRLLVLDHKLPLKMKAHFLLDPDRLSSRCPKVYLG